MGCVRWAVRCSRINKCPLELLPPESRAMAVSVTGLSPFCEVPGSIISSYSRSALMLLPKMDSWKFLSLCSNYAGLLSDCDISVYLFPYWRRTISFIFVLIPLLQWPRSLDFWSTVGSKGVPAPCKG